MTPDMTRKGQLNKDSSRAAVKGARLDKPIYLCYNIT
jgi:hypothetical protein